MRLRSVVLILLVLALTSGMQWAWGQGSASTITGQALDPSGAVVPAAKVVAANEASGAI